MESQNNFSHQLLYTSNIFLFPLPYSPPPLLLSSATPFLPCNPDIPGVSIDKHFSEAFLFVRYCRHSKYLQ